jgi:hypothetical protein
MLKLVSFCMDDHVGCPYIRNQFCLLKYSVEPVLKPRNSQQNNVNLCEVGG